MAMIEATVHQTLMIMATNAGRRNLELDAVIPSKDSPSKTESVVHGTPAQKKRPNIIFHNGAVSIFRHPRQSGCRVSFMI